MHLPIQSQPVMRSMDIFRTIQGDGVTPSGNPMLLKVCLLNCSEYRGKQRRQCIFQCQLKFGPG